MSYHDKPRPTPEDTKANWASFTVNGVAYPICWFNWILEEHRPTYGYRFAEQAHALGAPITARTGHYHGWRLKTLKP